MNQTSLDPNYSSHLGMVVRPDFLAAVCCLDEILSDSSFLSHILGKFLVHQTCRKHLEGPPLVLGLDVSNGPVEPSTRCIPGVVTVHLA